MFQALLETLPAVQAVLQVLASLAVVVVAIAALRALRAGQAGNRIQLDLDLQVMDAGAGEHIGELMVNLQNVGPRMQAISNLFIEVRPSRHTQSAAGPVVAAINMIPREDGALQIPPGVRHALTWTFEIPRDERLLRATVAIGPGGWVDPGEVTSLGPKAFALLGPSRRYLSRVFDVSSAGFRRF